MILEDGGFIIAPVKKKHKIDKTILSLFTYSVCDEKVKNIGCILYIEINKKVPRKIVRKINIKNVIMIFFIVKLMINKKY